jgi:hypothetical protein
MGTVAAERMTDDADQHAPLARQLQQWQAELAQLLVLASSDAEPADQLDGAVERSLILADHRQMNRGSRLQQFEGSARIHPRDFASRARSATGRLVLVRSSCKIFTRPGPDGADRV